jgi:hypothetical protein
VELAPAVLPAGLDLLGVRGGELGRQSLAGLAVRGELDVVATFDLLEAVGGELKESRPGLLGLVERDRDRNAPQRKALFSLSKNPSSAL